MSKRGWPAVLAGLFSWAGAAVADGGAIPFRHDTAAAGGALPGGALGLLLLSLVAIVAVYWVRKRLNLHNGRGGTERHLKVLETQRLGPRALLTVVEFGGKQYLLAQTEQGVNCLATVPASPVLPDAAGERA